jgi:hypothetical protein
MYYSLLLLTFFCSSSPLLSVTSQRQEKPPQTISRTLRASAPYTVISHLINYGPTSVDYTVDHGMGDQVKIASIVFSEDRWTFFSNCVGTAQPEQPRANLLVLGAKNENEARCVKRCYLARLKRERQTLNQEYFQEFFLPAR